MDSCQGPVLLEAGPQDESVLVERTINMRLPEGGRNWILSFMNHIDSFDTYSFLVISAVGNKGFVFIVKW